ncbi:MAG: arginine deiminase [Bacteroidales bacterium]|nr:arginine deiminase [Bacteroidales bacterium]
MTDNKELLPCPVNVSSETGRLKAVILHRPGVEIERMTPLNCAHALYNDILDKMNVDAEYALFSGVLERWAKVYYVEDVLEHLLERPDIRKHLVRESVFNYGLRPVKLSAEVNLRLARELMEMDSRDLTKVLIEGYENPRWEGIGDDRYLLEPLYNLLFTRDAASTVYNRVLINSMSFEVRERESLIYDVLFRNFFNVETLNAELWNPKSRTEGGDIHIASDDLLLIGEGIRTNAKGIEYLARTIAQEKEHFNIIVQELPRKPESFIHLDMVFTLLGNNYCMAFEPMLRRQGMFAGKDTTLITIDGGKISYHPVNDILDGLGQLGWDLMPILGGGTDPWVQMREQWHSGANFFCLGDGKVLGYRRNAHTIEALDRAGFSVLQAEDIVSGKTDMEAYERFVAVFPASELPRAGGGARCMTMPVWRED